VTRCWSHCQTTLAAAGLIYSAPKCISNAITRSSEGMEGWIGSCPVGFLAALLPLPTCWKPPLFCSGSTAAAATRWAQLDDWAGALAVVAIGAAVVVGGDFTSTVYYRINPDKSPTFEIG